MAEFMTDWFNTSNSIIQAKCLARVVRNYKEIRIDWTVLMRLKATSDTVASSIYIDTMVNSTKWGEDTARIKEADEVWTGTTEHGISGTIIFEDENAGSGTLTFSSTGNFASPDIFTQNLNISYEKYDPDAASTSVMQFHSVFTTEEYLAAHKNLRPRNNLCNNKSKYVFRYNEY